MEKQICFVFQDYEGNTHKFTKENLKERNKEFRLVGVENVEMYTPTLLTAGEYSSFLRSGIVLKESVFQEKGLYTVVSYIEDILNFSLIDESGTSIFELAVTDDASYEKYLLGMKILKKKVDFVTGGNHAF